MRIMNAISTLGPHVEEVNTLSLDDPEIFTYPVIYIIEVELVGHDGRRGGRAARPICERAAS